MKKLFFLTVWALTVFYGCSPDYRTVDRPAFGFRNSSTLEIESIEMTDSATVVNVKAFFRPKNWIMIAADTYLRSGAKGEKSIVTRAEGIPLGEEYYMPESGEHSFTLYFPPIDPRTKTIDFIESDCENCFKIYDIELVPRKWEPTAPAVKNAGVDEGFSGSVLSDRKAVYKGKIAGYQERYLAGSFKLFIENPVVGNNFETGGLDIPVRPDGSFEVEADVYLPTIAWAQLAVIGPSIPVYLEPGRETVQTIDLKAYGRSASRFSEYYDTGLSYVFSDGSLAKANEDLSRIPESVKIFPDYTKLRGPQVSETTPDAFKALVNGDADNAIADLEAVEDLSPRLKALYENQINLHRVYLLSNYVGIIQSAKASAAGVKSNEEFQALIKALDIPVPPKAYYDFFGYVDPDDEITYTHYMSSSLPRMVMNALAGNKPANLQELLADPRVAEIVGGDKGLFYEMAEFSEVNNRLSTLAVLTPEEMGVLQSKLSGHPVLYARLSAANEQNILRAEENKTKTGFTIYETPRVGNEQLLPAILENYRGKVVFVDFWETWCQPCRVAMKDGEPVKKDFEGKDVVFLYLASESSPKEAWDNMVPNIKGDHYYFTNEQMGYLRNKHNITGVPSYMLIDRTGRQRHFQTGFMGATRMKSMIAELLEE